MSAWRRVRARVKSWHWEYARDGYHGASANLTVVAAALRTEHDRLRAWTAAHAAAPEPEPAAAGERFEEDALPGAATPAPRLRRPARRATASDRAVFRAA